MAGAHRGGRAADAASSFLRPRGAAPRGRCRAAGRIRTSRAASRTAAAGFIDLWQGNRLLNTLVSDRGRLMISMFAIHLHLLSRPNDPHSGLTVSRMTALCSEQKFCSSGRAKAILMLMRVFGHLAPAPNEADRRLRRLVPTDRLFAVHSERNRRLFRAIVMVLPEYAQAFSAQSHPGFTAAFVCRYCEQFLTGFRFTDAAPDMRLFVEHNAGIMILCSIMMAGEADDAYPPTRPVSVSASALSRRFGVSRAHVRRLLLEAEEARIDWNGTAAIMSACCRGWSRHRRMSWRRISCSPPIARKAHMSRSVGKVRQPEVLSLPAAWRCGVQPNRKAPSCCANSHAPTVVAIATMASSRTGFMTDP